MKGSEIILTPTRGFSHEGLVYGTPKPGTIMQLRAAVEPVNGRHTWEAYDRTADGNRPQGPITILNLDMWQGKIETDAYVSGDRCALFIPWPGCEANMLVSAAGTGTGDAQAIAGLYIADDGTGYLVATTSTIESEPFVCLETLADVVPTGTLTWCMFTGY